MIVVYKNRRVKKALEKTFLNFNWLWCTKITTHDVKNRMKTHLKFAWYKILADFINSQAKEFVN